MVLAPPADDKVASMLAGDGIYGLIRAFLWRRCAPCFKLPAHDNAH